MLRLISLGTLGSRLCSVSERLNVSSVTNSRSHGDTGDQQPPRIQNCAKFIYFPPQTPLCWGSLQHSFVSGLWSAPRQISGHAYGDSGQKVATHWPSIQPTHNTVMVCMCCICNKVLFVCSFIYNVFLICSCLVLVARTVSELTGIVTNMSSKLSKTCIL